MDSFPVRTLNNEPLNWDGWACGGSHESVGRCECHLNRNSRDGTLYAPLCPSAMKNREAEIEFKLRTKRLKALRMSDLRLFYSVFPMINPHSLSLHQTPMLHAHPKESAVCCCLNVNCPPQAFCPQLMRLFGKIIELGGFGFS